MADNQPDFDEIFKLVTIDQVRKKRISVKIVDADGDEVPFKATVRQIMDWVNDKVKLDTADPQNQIVSQILPLVTQAMVTGLPEASGPRQAAQLLSSSSVRMSVVMMMLLSFSMLKLIQQKNLKIITTEEDITEEEYEKLMRLSEVTEIVSMGTMAGHSPKDVIRALMKQGKITAAEVVEMTGGTVSTDLSDTDEDPTLN